MMPRSAPPPDGAGPPPRSTGSDEPAPDTIIALAWAIVSRRRVTVNLIMLAVVIMAAAIGLALALGPAGVAAIVAGLGAWKGAHALRRQHRRAHELQADGRDGAATAPAR